MLFNLNGTSAFCQRASRLERGIASETDEISERLNASLIALISVFV